MAGTRSAAADETQTKKISWWQSAVLYQIYPRSFQDSNGDGVGDLAGIIDRLGYVKRLGVDAIWLSPIFPSPMADFGYDVSDYTAIDPVFGDLAIFDALVAKAHEMGLRILLDFIPNHTSSKHPWFLESRSSRNSPKRDWYIWKDAKAGGSPPNNWLSVMGGPAWEWDAATNQYYLHSFLKEQPDLNWTNPAVREAMYDVLRFWLARGVDGFRIDAVYHIGKDPTFADAPPNPMPDPRVGEYDTQLHLGHDKGFPSIHRYLRGIRQAVEEAAPGREPLTIGESHIWDWGEWATYYGEKLDELHFPFNFAFTRGGYTAARARQIVHDLEAAIPDGAWPNYVLGNHDESRIATRIGHCLAPLAMLMLLTLRGTPTMYYGDELGMEDVQIPPQDLRDPVALRVPGHGRDPERTPMQWDAGRNAGFCPPEAKPWLPLGANYATVNVAVEQEEPGSLLALTRRILSLRRSSRALSLGAYDLVELPNDEVFIYLRTAAEERYLIALNCSQQDQTLQVGSVIGATNGTLVLSTGLDREGLVTLDTLTLRPCEGVVIQLA